MILGFQQERVPKILSGTKIHTIREDKHRRWKTGRKIHFATGVRTKNYNQFKLGFCVSVQTITMDFRVYPVPFIVDGKLLSTVDKLRLVENDGFDNYFDLFNFFGKPYDYFFSGVIIHWTSFKYHKKSGFTYGVKSIVMDEVNKLPKHLQDWANGDWSKNKPTREDLKEIRKKLRANAILIPSKHSDKDDHAYDAIRYGTFMPFTPKKVGLFTKIKRWIFKIIRKEDL